VRGVEEKETKTEEGAGGQKKERGIVIVVKRAKERAVSIMI
jgi:hypothetical protein